MFYSVYVSSSIQSLYKQIEVSSKEEAEKLLEKLKEEYIENIKRDLSLVSVSGRVSLSDENYKFGIGGVYLFKKYSSLIPVVCKRSEKDYGWRKRRGWVHKFVYFDGGQTLILKGIKGSKSTEKIVKELCRDGKIGEERCNTCDMKFRCYTRRK